MTDRSARRYAAVLLAVLATACAPREPARVAKPVPADSPPVVVAPAPPQTPATVPPLASAAPGSVAPAPLPGVAVPPGAIYVCVTDSGGQRTQTVIPFAPKVHALCRRHPEMGPCQYERNVCRSTGGRVFAANGQEITMATEAEYDRRVMRVRFRSN